MKPFHGFGIGLAVTLVASGVWLGCGDDTTGSSGGPVDGGTPDSTTPTDSGGTVDSGAPVDAGSAADTSSTADAGSADTGSAADAGDAATTIACSTYCTDVMAACGTTAPYAQYQSMEECLFVCPLLKAATPDLQALTAVGTIACREEHAQNALSADAGSAAGGFGKGLGPNPHCWHAGPYGGSVCGDPCTSFCYLDTMFCSAADGFDSGPPPYSDLAACLAKCPSFPEVDSTDAGWGNDGGFNAVAGNTTGTNTLDCREYHLLNAMNAEAGASPEAQQATHCPHTASISANGVCGDAGP